METSFKKCHLIGIGGIGMSGLARLLLQRQVSVTGSDLNRTATIENLQSEGAQVFIGHSSNHVQSDMTVIYSTDIPTANPEYQAALAQKCQLLHRSDLLAALTHGYQTLAVAGTHGKTTTSSLLTWVFLQAGLDPSFAIGGILPSLKTNAQHGKGKYFILEADESDGTFLKYTPTAAIITNIDLDHMSYFGDEKALHQAFAQFATRVQDPNQLFWCGEDARLHALALPGIAYGFDGHQSLCGSNYVQEAWKIYFDVDFKGCHYSRIEVPLIGKHNALNALSVFGLALSLGLDETVIRKAFKTFPGVLRRMEKKGEQQGILFYDDYAHHPTEIETTLQGIRQAIGPKRLIAIFQPHRYSRTKDCLGSYGSVFNAVDMLYVTEIYGAGEVPIPGLTSEKIIQELQLPADSVRLIQRAQVAEIIAKELQTHDVVVSLGAGDITKVSGEILAQFAHQSPKKLKVGVVCGGRSMEHEVSITSSQYVYKGLNADLYDIAAFAITKDGQWIADRAAICPEKKCIVNAEKGPILGKKVLEQLLECDLFFPILHGPYGEDGAIQGLFEMLDKPFVGCNPTAAAIAMDKVKTKQLLRDSGIHVIPFVSFNRYDWTHSFQTLVNRIKDELTFPVFVKPVHLGSSTGISKVEKIADLETAVQSAFKYDYEIIVETGVVAREIEFVVLGNDNPLVLPPGEVLTHGALHDYESKYSVNGARFDTRATLSKELIDEGMDIAKRAFKIVGGTGLARIDFFLDSDHRYWLNEVNTMPGMTPTSLYPLICEANGINAQELMDRLIILALERKRIQRRQVVK